MRTYKTRQYVDRLRLLFDQIQAEHQELEEISENRSEAFQESEAGEREADQVGELGQGVDDLENAIGSIEEALE